MIPSKLNISFETQSFVLNRKTGMFDTGPRGAAVYKYLPQQNQQRPVPTKEPPMMIYFINFLLGHYLYHHHLDISISVGLLQVINETCTFHFNNWKIISIISRRCNSVIGPQRTLQTKQRLQIHFMTRKSSQAVN